MISLPESQSEAVGYRLRIQELEAENAKLTRLVETGNRMYSLRDKACAEAEERAEKAESHITETVSAMEEILQWLDPVAKLEREVQLPFSKEEIVRRVREARERGATVTEIAKRYGLSESTVYLYLKEKERQP